MPNKLKIGTKVYIAGGIQFVGNPHCETIKELIGRSGIFLGKHYFEDEVYHKVQIHNMPENSSAIKLNKGVDKDIYLLLNAEIEKCGECDECPVRFICLTV